MEDLELLNAIGWWAMRKRRSYVRPAHYQSALHHNSFAAFWRYYNSPDEGDLKLFLRLSQTEFEAVYSLVRHQLEAHCPTHLRPIEGKERLAVFIRFTAFGPTYSAVAPLFVIVIPRCMTSAKSISDAESHFLMVDIGASGQSPEAALPPNEDSSLPFIFLGDGGFGCTDLIVTPFTDRGADSQEKIAFNCRLSRARSAVEHAFGIFASRWRIFLGTIEARPETARLYTLAAVILHNFLNPVEENLNFDFQTTDECLLIKGRLKLGGKED
uniref:DDE Tnp4 domain-containing protein n=1 Tax=Ditylenchus dipsaci TaxID=166011 RepID=A0A915EDM1_9BILA